MEDIEVQDLLTEKNEDALLKVARRVGKCLTDESVPDAERLAADALARHLVNDAIKRVRLELSNAVKHSKYLARDVAFTIARDVESIACPFLEVTEVFSEDDWQELVVTISRGARIAVASRKSISEGLAIALTETGEADVAQTLVENEATPVTTEVCQALIRQFEISPCVLDKLAERTDLGTEIATDLVTKVSATAREKLSKQYDLHDHIGPIALEAETAAILQLIRQTPGACLRGLAHRLQRDNKLTHHLLMRAVCDCSLDFFIAALSVLSGQRLDRTSTMVRCRDAAAFAELLHQAGIPSAVHDDFLGRCSRSKRAS